MINKNRLIRLTQDLIRIPSVNPHGNEAAIALYVKRYLEKLHIPVRCHSFAKDRVNVIARLAGTHRTRSLLLTPHLDTVPPGKGWSRDPFDAVVRGDKIYGLGATDCKGNLAAALEAMHSLHEDGVRLEYTLCMAATADEESGSVLGLIPLLQKGFLDVDCAVVLDADDGDIIVTQKGLMHLTLTVAGKRAHGAYPWRGVNAIEAMAAILQQLQKTKWQYRANRYLHPPTVNPGVIRGGDKVNVVADWCACELDFRFLPGMSHQALLTVLRTIARKHARDFSITVQGVQKPYAIDATHPLVRQLYASMLSAGGRPRIKGSEGATVITFFQGKNIPAVASGFGVTNGAHVVDEYISIASLYNGTRALEHFLKNFTFK